MPCVPIAWLERSDQFPLFGQELPCETTKRSGSFPGPWLLLWLSRLAGFVGGKAVMVRLAQRVRPYGTTIFSEISRLALAAGAVNLGQGDPEIPTPPELVALAHKSLEGDGLAYARPIGFPDLNRAVAEHQARFYGLSYDPNTEVTITVGASEAVMASALTLIDPGDEVIVF